MNDVSEFEQFSNFNMSIATLQRIDILLKGLNNTKMIGDILLFQRGLLVLYDELIPFLNDKERVEGKSYLEKLYIAVYLEKEKVLYDIDAIFLMFQFNQWQRDKLHDKHLLMSKGEDPGDSLR